MDNSANFLSLQKAVDINAVYNEHFQKMPSECKLATTTHKIKTTLKLQMKKRFIGLTFVFTTIIARGKRVTLNINNLYLTPVCN